MKKEMKRIGLFLALIAVIGFAAHIGHAELQNGTDHCLICHTPSTSSHPVVKHTGPTFQVSNLLVFHFKDATRPTLYRLDSPRAPPSL